MSVSTKMIKQKAKNKEGLITRLKGKIAISERTAPYVFLAPVMIIFSLFMVYPIIKSLILCTQSFVNGQYVFVGVDNFIKLFKDPIFWKSLSNTFIYLIIQVPIMVFLSLLLAVLLDSKFLRAKGFFRMSLFLPAITALVAYAMIFKLMLNTDYGMINHVIGLFGMEKIDWLNTAWGARISIILGITWRWTGYNNGFQFFKFGYASALSYTLVVIIALLSYLQFKVTKGGEI